MNTVYNKPMNDKPAITVAELIQQLQKLPQQLPIVATWEGVYAAILPECILKEEIMKIDCIVINVNDYDWKCLKKYEQSETP